MPSRAVVVARRDVTSRAHRRRVDETSRRDDDARAGSTTAREGIVDAAVSRRGIADARANAPTIDSG